MRIFDLFQVLVVPFPELTEGFVLLINGDTFSKDSLLIQPLRLGPEVMDKQLNDDGDPDVSNLIVLQLVDLLRDQSLEGKIKFCLLFPLLFS